jgi:murein DD-endopeptidase MepM/ murein hydrolase activator NlpD
MQAERRANLLSYAEAQLNLAIFNLQNLFSFRQKLTFMNKKLFFTIIFTILSFATFANVTSEVTNPNSNHDFTSLIDFFKSYTSVETQNTIDNETSNDDFYAQFSLDNENSTLVNPYKVSLDSLPDSVYIACADYCYPTISQRITSRFGIRGARFHSGIDVGVQHGDTIRTPFSGVVRYVAYQRGGYGRYLIIRHDNGLESVMAHFSRTLVKTGDTIMAGTPVGLGGSTGRSTGPHLHLEFRFLGNPFNPEKLINFATTEININTDSNAYLMTKADTYSHRAQLEEMKRAAYHRVRSGETLSHIARRYGTTVSRLCALNRLKQTSILQIGQRIRYR